MKKNICCIFFVLLISFPLYAQQRITGNVSDSQGDPLPGVNVLVKGTTIGVVSDSNGAYSIDAPNKESVLTFSFVGFSTQEYTVGDQRQINVVLEEDTKVIDEVVVVGYGVQKKVNLTGAVTSVKMDEIMENRPIASVTNALMGSVPGLVFSGYSAEPGSEYTIKVRGTDRKSVV